LIRAVKTCHSLKSNNSGQRIYQQASGSIFSSERKLSREDDHSGIISQDLSIYTQKAHLSGSAAKLA